MLSVRNTAERSRAARQLAEDYDRNLHATWLSRQGSQPHDVEHTGGERASKGIRVGHAINFFVWHCLQASVIAWCKLVAAAGIVGAILVLSHRME